MIIVTGADQGLGAAVAAQAPGEVANIPGFTIRHGKAAIDAAVKEIGPVTHVVNNFGINHLSWIGDTPAEDAEILRVNVMGPYWVINALVAAGQTCRVVNVASATYRVPQRCTALYCASKAALVQMTRVMARELAPKGWVINAIAPGAMPDTIMAQLTTAQVLELRGWEPKAADQYALSLIPMARATSTKEVARAIWQIMELPDYINGTVIDMMGGS